MLNITGRVGMGKRKTEVSLWALEVGTYRILDVKEPLGKQC